jgi:MFS family permease
LTTIQWVIIVIAIIGFAFDTYEILMLPLVVRPALLELTGAAPGSPEFQAWVGRLFYIPAFAGGIFGLFGGYLTDRFGRRRVLTYSIMIYALGAFASGFSTSIAMLLVLRCFVFIGVCVEFVAAVAWLAELFPEPKLREKVLGWTQACSSFGGLLVATANGLCVAYATSFPAIPGLDGPFDAQAPWRYTLMSGVIPAIPLLIVRPFLPESPAWQLKKAAGTLKRPSIAALFAPDLRRTTIVTTLMMAMAYGAAFGAIQQVPQIVPGLPEVQARTQGLPPPQAALVVQEVASTITKVQETGGLVGRVLLAYLAVVIVSRRRLIH